MASLNGPFGGGGGHSSETPATEDSPSSPGAGGLNRAVTAELLGLFIRPQVGADSPPAVYLLRRADTQQFGPFMTHYSGNKSVSRTLHMSRVIRQQIPESEGLAQLELQFRHPSVGGSLAYVDVASQEDPEKRDVIIVQIGALPRVKVGGGAAAPSEPYLYLTSAIFDEAHKGALARLELGQISKASESLKVDRLVSVPLQHLLALCKGLPPNSRPGVLRVEDKRGEEVALHPLFSAALTSPGMVAALEAAFAHLQQLGELAVVSARGSPPSPVQHRGAAALGGGGGGGGGCSGGDDGDCC